MVNEQNVCRYILQCTCNMLRYSIFALILIGDSFSEILLKCGNTVYEIKLCLTCTFFSLMEVVQYITYM